MLNLSRKRRIVDGSVMPIALIAVVGFMRGLLPISRAISPNCCRSLMPEPFGRPRRTFDAVMGCNPCNAIRCIHSAHELTVIPGRKNEYLGGLVRLYRLKWHKYSIKALNSSLLATKSATTYVTQVYEAVQPLNQSSLCCLNSK